MGVKEAEKWDIANMLHTTLLCTRLQAPGIVRLSSWG